MKLSHFKGVEKMKPLDQKLKSIPPKTEKGRSKHPEHPPKYASRPRGTSSPLEQYLAEIEAFNLLSREEEAELASRYRDHGDDEAYFKLVSSNLRLVVKIAMSHQKRSVGKLLDLIQEGNLGLIQAAKKFDPDRGARFSYYAVFWIRAYIMRFIMANSKLVKIGTTQNQRRLFYNLHRERKTIALEGRTPEPGLLADRLGVNEESVMEMECRLGSSEISLDSFSPIESGFHPFSEQGDAENRLSEEQTTRMVQRKLKNFRTGLSDKRAFIFDYRIMADDPLTLREIGEKYAISRERVRQIEKSIVGSLGKWLSAEAPEIEQSFSP
jgi:RNA polymerase sigma-32 factor